MIEHALVVQSDTVCAGVFRAPAIKTDGDSTRTDCLPEGARLQLDPSIDVSKITGITPAERTVARALQRYGAYVIDRGGAPLSVSFERAPDATASSPGSAYVAAGTQLGLLRHAAHPDGNRSPRPQDLAGLTRRTPSLPATFPV